MTRPASSLNTEFDSRIVRVSAGAVVVTRPTFARAPVAELDRGDRKSWGDAAVEAGVFAKVYCLNCGKPGGAVSAEIPVFLRGDPGVIYVCPDCDGKLGPLPAQAISFARRD